MAIREALLSPSYQGMRPSKYTTAQHWDRQDARQALRYGTAVHTPDSVSYTLELGERLTEAPMAGADYMQVWNALGYLRAAGNLLPKL